MNKQRRKTLASIARLMETLDNLRQEIAERLEEVIDEEQEALDNMPESLQESEKGEQMQEYIDIMSDIKYELEQLDLEDWASQLTNI